VYMVIVDEFILVQLAPVFRTCIPIITWLFFIC